MIQIFAPNDLKHFKFGLKRFCLKYRNKDAELLGSIKNHQEINRTKGKFPNPKSGSSGRICQNDLHAPLKNHWIAH